jgi:hypothetical protein
MEDGSSFTAGRFCELATADLRALANTFSKCSLLEY